ncbi:hypothetical protein PHLCEN_2v7916 [Hermanssonia centrifuga]|uniref:Uncharacterized protein n=1 Tax=Hermanssonia centrifuga TaxID=98765 RepID=A0A2R6NV60_9APHY|nr:hypothetical protein PHLCEN_2v7916 [Hermanssonia centrifuga]
MNALPGYAPDSPPEIIRSFIIQASAFSLQRMAWATSSVPILSYHMPDPPQILRLTIRSELAILQSPMY